MHFVPWNQSTFEYGRQQLELVHKENENMLQVVTVTVPAVQLERDALSDTTVKCKNMVVYPRSLLDDAKESLVLHDTTNTDAYFDWFSDVRQAHEDFIFKCSHGTESAAHLDWLSSEMLLNFGIVGRPEEAESYFEVDDSQVAASRPIPVEPHVCAPKRQRLKPQMAPK